MKEQKEIRIVTDEPKMDVRTVLADGNKYYEYFQKGRIVKRILVNSYRKTNTQEIEDFINKARKGSTV